jgi:1-acyl-sn-glycerol-3-phosphate acyltransferase
VLGIRSRVEGAIPPGPHLIAVKHQSMFETTEMVRLTKLPVIVMKRELARIPLFGWLTRRYGVIVVDRSAGAKALRSLVEEGKDAVASGRSVIIYPEGTRVRVGESPPLQAGFAALYRALGLPVVPVAVDSGRLWGRGLAQRSGTVTFRIGETIPPGLKREEIESQVHAAINALESAPQAGA